MSLKGSLEHEFCFPPKEEGGGGKAPCEKKKTRRPSQPVLKSHGLARHSTVKKSLVIFFQPPANRLGAKTNRSRGVLTVQAERVILPWVITLRKEAGREARER